MAETETFNSLFATPNVNLSHDTIEELQSITRLLSISPQELFFKWESYVIKMGVETTKLDYKTVKDFRKDLQDALERESRAKGHGLQSANKKAASTPRASSGGGDVYGMIDGMATATPGPRSNGTAKRKADNFATPASKSAKNGMHSSPSDFKTPAALTTAFSDRTNAGQIIESLNSHLPGLSSSGNNSSESRVKLKANTELNKFAYRGMAMKLSEASEILDDRIDTFTELIQSHHQLPDGAFGNPAAQSTAEIVAVGRIACDSPTAKLNAASLVLETSRRMGAGLRVPLRMADGVSYDFFPGKIVALRGTNVGGEFFSATEVLSLPSLPPAASTPDEIDVHNSRLESADGEATPLGLLVASGPYTTDTDLNFAPLQALLDKAAEVRTDVLILTGPFLDLEHPAIASGDLDDHLPADAKIDPDRATVNDVFRILVGQPISRLIQQVPTITVILVPSVRDAISKHVCWPQDRFPKALLGLPKQVQVVTNPITLSINEMVFGICAQDTLSELRRENVCSSTSNNKTNFGDDILARLSGSIIEQRHFFPIFPPQGRDNLPKVTAIPGEIPDPGAEERLPVGASLDIGYLKLGEWLNVRPDVLILPSVLSAFAKVVDSVLCINPGTLSKRRGAGSYAAMSMQARSLTDEEREATEPVAHNVFERGRVDVVRI